MSFEKVTLELSQRFVNGLKSYDLTKEEIENWRYVGGGHLTNSLRHELLQQRFKKEFPEVDPPGLEARCVCGHPIQENAFISDGENLLVLGSCCVRRFTKTGTKKTCGLCGNLWKGKTILCSSCR